jgi:hypothetical protein
MKVVVEFDLPEGQAIPDPRDIVRLTSPDWVTDWWHISDVQESVDVEMTDEECREVLNQVERYKDNNIGINWEVIRYYAGEVLDEREEILE